MNATSTLDNTGTGRCVFKHSTCEAELHLNGAHITHWQPAGQRPVIFVSPKAIFAPGTPIRGGVPICLPWFGPHPTDPQAPAHGLVRTKPWQLIENLFDASGWKIHLRDEQKEPAGPYWTHPFVADFYIGFGHTLSMELRTTNTGDTAFTFSDALHSYFTVSDVRQVAIEGLQGREYFDKTHGNTRKREEDPLLRLTNETDRVYVDTTTTCTIIDPSWKRRLVVEKTGSQSTVVWNPFETRASQLADLGSGNWPGFICVETANCVDNVIQLPPGRTHVTSVGVRIEPIEAAT